MVFVHDLLVLLHFVGLASLFGGYLVQIRSGPRVNSAMLHGALTLLVTGLGLVGVADMNDTDDVTVDHVKIGVKLAIVLIITALGFANRKKDKVPHGLFHALGILTLAATAIAVFWH